MSFALICLSAVFLYLLHSIQAQNSPQDYLDAHNAARAMVGVEPLTWDDQVAQFALDYATTHVGDCQLVHSSWEYGENLAINTGTMSGTDAVNMWIREKADYHYDSNTCGDGKVCGHYTQVVSSNSVNVGCAKVRCNNGGTFIGCNYSPAVPLGIGLVESLIEINEFIDNVQEVFYSISTD